MVRIIGYVEVDYSHDNTVVMIRIIIICYLRFLPFLREVSQVAHLKQSTWKTQCRAFMTRSVELMSIRHLAQHRDPPYSLKREEDYNN